MFSFKKVDKASERQMGRERERGASFFPASDTHGVAEINQPLPTYWLLYMAARSAGGSSSQGCRRGDQTLGGSVVALACD